MCIRRNIIAPVLIAVGAIGSLAAGPVLAITTRVAPTSAAVAIGAHPAVTVYGG